MSLRSAFLSSLTSPCFLRGSQLVCPGVRAVGLLLASVNNSPRDWDVVPPGILGDVTHFIFS
jgi:hypothetical protein